MPLFKAILWILLWLPFTRMAGQRTQSVPVYDSFDAFAAKELQAPEKGVRLVNFWATWCKPCVKELPYFQQLHDKYPNLSMLLVSLDKKSDAESRIADFLTKRGINIEVVVLADGRANDWIDKISPDWSGSIPATLLLTPYGTSFFETDFESLQDIEEKTQIISHLQNKH